MRSLALFVVLSALSAALAIGGTLAAVAHCGTLSAEQRARLVEELDRAVDGWQALKTPAEARRVVFFVGGEPDTELLEPPAGPAPVWTALWSLARGGSLRAEHERRLQALIAPGAFVSDWYQQGRLWADEKRRRQDALAVAVGKARRAGARVVLISDARGADDTVRALKSAPVSSADEALVDRLIAVGAGEFPDTPRAAELVSLWHSEGDSVTPAGTQFRLRDASGRLRQQTLEGEAATAEGAAKLVRELTAGAAAADALKTVGQALAAPAAPLVSSEPAPPSGPAPRAAAGSKAAEPSGPLASVAAMSARSVANPASVPRGWSPTRIDGPTGPIGWTIASPTADMAEHLSGRTTCARNAELSAAASDAIPAGCKVSICLQLHEDKTIQQLVAGADYDGALISKVVPSSQFGTPAYFFVKSRPKKGETYGMDTYRFDVAAKPYLIELRYEIDADDPQSCGRPFFDIFDKAAHSIAPER